MRFVAYDAGGHGEYQELHQAFFSAGALYLASTQPWSVVYAVMAAAMGLGVVVCKNIYQKHNKHITKIWQK